MKRMVLLAAQGVSPRTIEGIRENDRAETVRLQQHLLPEGHSLA